MFKLSFGEKSLLRVVVQMITTSGMIENNKMKDIIAQNWNVHYLHYLALSQKKFVLILTDTKYWSLEKQLFTSKEIHSTCGTESKREIEKIDVSEGKFW